MSRAKRAEITLEPLESEAPKTMSTDDRIHLLEAKLSEPGISAQAAASLNRQISQLQAGVVPGVYRRESVNSCGAVTEAIEKRKLKTELPEEPTDEWLSSQEGEKGISWPKIWLAEWLAGRRIVSSPRIEKVVMRFWESLTDSEQRLWQAEFGKAIPLRNPAGLTPPVSVSPIID